MCCQAEAKATLCKLFITTSGSLLMARFCVEVWLTSSQLLQRPRLLDSYPTHNAAPANALPMVVPTRPPILSLSVQVWLVRGTKEG